MYHQGHSTVDCEQFRNYQVGVGYQVVLVLVLVFLCFYRMFGVWRAGRIKLGWMLGSDKMRMRREQIDESEMKAKNLAAAPSPGDGW